MSRWLLVVVFLIAGLMPVPARAQAAAQRGRLLVTVADPSGAVIPGATVTVVGLDNATKVATVAPAKTTEQGIATLDGLVLGRYSIRAEFPGFELGLLRDIRVSRGDNKHVVLLPLKGMSESVTVGRDGQAAASTRASLGSALTREQIEALSDEPDEMQRQLNELAGPNATMRVDSFEGSQLPPKSQIKSIHITRDQYAAENHYIGGLFIDIITQPGVGPIRGNGNFGFNGSALNGRTAFTPKKGPEQNKNYGFGFGGTLAKRKSDFSLNVFGNNSYATPILYAFLPEGIRAETLKLRTPRENESVSGSLNYAVTRDQTLRFSGSFGRNSQRNQGAGGYNLADRTFSTEGHNAYLYIQEAGPLGRRFFTNTRAQIRWATSSAHSTLEAPTIVINDAFTTGGAQRAGGSQTRGLMLQSDLDYVRGINSWRAGIMFEGTWYHSDDASNYLGTYTFTSLEAFNAGTPTFFSRRIGDPTIAYSNAQAGIYLQDDIRVSKSLTLSPGIRYEAQTHVTDYNGLAPRFGATWSPFKSGNTTVRGGGGIVYDWLSTSTYAQTIRVDGFHQQDLTITNPTYPDPGNVGNVRATSRYLLGPDYVLPRSINLLIGVDQKITPRFRVSASYNLSRLSHVARGRNLNAPINGVRPDANFLNVIETVSDAASRSQEFYLNTSVSLLAPSPAANQARFNWKRLSVGAYYSFSHYRNNSDGAFGVPASGTLDTEWGPSPGSRRHQMSFSLNSNQIKNVNMGLSMNTYEGSAYNITTGHDDNGDLFFNDRPIGVSRNSARVPDWYRGLSARFGYNFTFGKGASSAPPGIMITGGGPGGVTVASAPPAANRYRMSISVNASNLTNRSNYSGYSGVMGSPGFGVPTSSGEPRRISLNTSFGF
jgi:hypothetical protein